MKSYKRCQDKFGKAHKNLARPFGLFTFLCFLASYWVTSYLNLPNLGQILSSLAIGMFIVTFFSIGYEKSIRTSFANMLDEINPNIQSGVTVYSSHANVIERHNAINQYLTKKSKVRIISSTGHHYVKKNEMACGALLDKIGNDHCELKLLLYMPVTQWAMGQNRQQSENLIKEQRALMVHYENMNEKSNVEIKFFTLPLHTNFIMLGDNRMYSSMILYSFKGESPPCYEMWPTGEDSPFYQFQQYFDDMFDNSDSATLDFKKAKKVYILENDTLDDFKANYKKVILQESVGGGSPKSNLHAVPWFTNSL